MSMSNRRDWLLEINPSHGIWESETILTKCSWARSCALSTIDQQTLTDYTWKAKFSITTCISTLPRTVLTLTGCLYLCQPRRLHLCCDSSGKRPRMVGRARRERIYISL